MAKAKVEIRAYCTKTKEKNVLMHKAEIHTVDLKGRKGYMAKGEDKDGNKMCVAISKVNAEAAIEAGVAKKCYK